MKALSASEPITAVNPNVETPYRRRAIDKSKEFLAEGKKKGLYGRALKRWATRKTKNWMKRNTA